MVSDMVKPERQANYELLRIIAMFMVVTLHYLNHTGALLALGESADAKRLIGTLIEALCIVAVNVYVLISGYFLVAAGFKVKRVLILTGQILFYSILIPLLLMGAGMLTNAEEGGIYRLTQYFLPIETEHYWFATSYVLLYLFTPLLNAAVLHMSKNQLQIALAGLLLLFSAVKSVCPIRLVTDRFGYDFGWFLCVYLTAAYIRLYGLKLFSTAKRSFGIYFGCAFAMFGIVGGAYYLNLETGAFSYYFTVPFHYNFILCLAGAVALFYGFRFMKLPAGRVSKAICAVSPLTFGVYLFHEHIDIRNIWAVWIGDYIGPASEKGAGGFLVHLMLSVLLVYSAGMFIDFLRKVIFSYIGQQLKRTKPAGWIDRIDEAFASDNKTADGS